MAYTIYNTTAFPSGGAVVDGYDYQNCEDLIKKVQELSVGRFYIDEQGNAVYESRHARTE